LLLAYAKVLTSATGVLTNAATQMIAEDFQRPLMLYLDDGFVLKP